MNCIYVFIYYKLQFRVFEAMHQWTRYHAILVLVGGRPLHYTTDLRPRITLRPISGSQVRDHRRMPNFRLCYDDIDSMRLENTDVVKCTIFLHYQCAVKSKCLGHKPSGMTSLVLVMTLVMTLV
jgi:hypothetical protein